MEARLAKYPTISDDLDIQLRYEDMRRHGQSHSVADMLAHQRPPQSDTDVEFMRSTENGRQFQDKPQIGHAYAEEALAAGINIKGKKYLSQLAEHPGDPRAWVGSKGEVAQLCEERGYSCDGKVKVKSPRREAPTKAVDVAPDILRSEVGKELSKIKDVRDVKVPDLVQQVKAKLTRT
jgi:hypothetical protein